jgi:hypothetical protein
LPRSDAAVGQVHVPFDVEFAESRYSAEASAKLAPDEAFDKEWALTLLDLTMERLRAEFVSASKPDDFAALKGCLMAAHGSIEYEAIASRLGVNEGAARVAVHRLRKRFRNIHRDELARTLAEGEDLGTELHPLVTALSRD